MADQRLPLARFKVLDLSRVRGGPVAVRQLADWGADVIKIEMPVAEEDDTGSRHRADFQNLHRNKRSLTLNLKSAEGIEILRKLVRGADVLVENYRPNVKHRLGIDYETLRKLNPRLVYGSLSGFGQDGPYADRPGVDQIAQGMGGVMSVTGLPGQGPVRCGAAIADVSSGLYLAFGIVMALLEREQSGEGQWVQTSLLEAQIGLMDFLAASWLFDRSMPEPAGNNHPKATPTGTYETKDGHINIGAGAQNRWERLCKALGGEELIARPEFRSTPERRKNLDACSAALNALTRKRTSAEWVEVLNAAGVPCGPVYSVDQTFADPQVRHLGIAAKVAHPKLGERALVGQPIHLSRATFAVRSATPEAGEHNDEILASLGYDPGQIATLRDRKVI